MSRPQMNGMTARHADVKEEHSSSHKLIRLYMPFLERDLIPSFITPDLEHLLGKDGMQRVSKAEEDSIENGARELLELLLTSKEPEWFNVFVKSLKDNGYGMIAQHLTDGVEVKDAEAFTELISKFYESLLSEVNSEDLLPYLLENGTISEKDVTDIKKAEENDDRRSAMFLLLLRLPQHKYSWLDDFIAVLRQNDSKSYHTLASVIESTIKQESSLITEQSIAVKNAMADKENPNTSVVASVDSNRPEIPNNLLAVSTEKKSLEIMNNFLDLNHADQAGASEANTDVKQECIVENCHHSADRKVEEIQAQPLVLRSYQKELARPALDGNNVIIMAPTGSGKTHVALYITQNHLESCAGKVVFLVPTTELVSQQTQMYQTYLSNYKVCGLSGEIQESQKVPLSSLIDINDIIVMTPQILLNALRKKNVQSLRVFTLMVFDECHHTTKEHPYNNIMASYLDEKYNTDRDYLLPQIVGLTASVGVGNARDPDRAKQHILALCANLDATGGISVVEEHKQELEKFVNKPNEKKIKTLGRVEDPFREKINEVMYTIEERIKDLIARNNGVKVQELMCIPSERGSDQYTQWISRLHREVAKIYDQYIRRPIYACQAHLRIYNTALMINDDCRTMDALTYLMKNFRAIDPEHKDKTDIWLDNLFENCKDELEHISHNPRYDNPKLKKLAELVLEKYKTNQDMRAIIFCKTREMTLALQKWMEETPELVVLSPNRLVGANASAEKGGMTLNKQVDVLSYFKDGKHKVIFATSVAEEGLDVSKCNLIIKYEYVTNEIGMVQARGRARAENSDYVVMGDHSRGSAQREEMNRIKENMMNKAIEIIKQMAEETRSSEIEKLQKEAISERRMNEVGKSMKATPHPEGSNDDWELRCMKCNEIGCLASDIRVFAESHHAVLDESFKDRIVIEPHPNPKVFNDMLMTDKIFCKKCHTDWGIRVIYKGVRICVIKINSFRVINVIKQTVFIPRKWRDAPFSVAILTSEELEQYCKGSTAEESFS